MDVVASDGTRLWAQVRGRGPPLVLVHGSGTDATTWSNVVDQLAGSYRVVVYDRRGYGRSTHPPVRDFRVHRDDLLTVLDGLREPAHVVAWSSGGNVALDAAVARPGPFRTLTVFEPPFRSRRGADVAAVKAVVGAKWHQLRGRRRDGAATVLRWATTTTDGGNGFDRLPDDVREHMLDQADSVLAELDPHPRGATGDHVAVRDVAALPVPLTWVFGSDSMRWFRRLAAPVTAARNDIAVVEIPGAGHQPHFEAPDAFVETVVAATKGSRPPGRHDG